MREVFRGWHRQTLCVLLLMTVLVSVVWASVYIMSEVIVRKGDEEQRQSPFPQEADTPSPPVAADALAPPSPEWDKRFNFKKPRDARRRVNSQVDRRADPTIPTLQNIPRIVETYRIGKLVRLTATNDGNTPLVYYGSSPFFIQEFHETDDGGRWKAGRWDWCGTGKRDYTIEPGQSATLVIGFLDDTRRERILGSFTDKGTGRSGLVVLAAEPADQPRLD